MESGVAAAPAGEAWAARLEFQLLGTLTVIGPDGRPLDLGTRKQRAVLALLLLDPGRVVSLDRIIHGLWADEAPSSATATLQAYISQLRRILEPGRLPRGAPSVLLTREPGYLLAVGPEQVDAARFTGQVTQARTLLAAGRCADAQQVLATALDLWHGEPLQEFADEAFAAPAVAQLHALRANAIEDLTEALLALGRNVSAAEQIRPVLERFPYRERAWGQLMLALYRDGRQADALAAYQRARAILDDELGLPPGPELRSLEASILRQDAALARPAGPVPAVVGPTPAPVTTGPAGSGAAQPVGPGTAETVGSGAAEPVGSGTAGPFAAGAMVGRAAQLAFVEARLRVARTGRGGLLLISGQAGVGKTLFAETAAESALGAAMTVVRSRCVEGGTTPAFWPWIQILRALGPDAGAERVLEVLSGRGEASLRPGDPDAARFLLYEAVGDVLRAAASRSPLLLVIDDLHLADASSLRLLTHIASLISQLPVLMLATLRSEPGDAGGPLRDALGALANERGVDRIGLHLFSLDDVADYLSRTTGRAYDDEAVRALYERTGGNPFYLKELLRLIGSEHPGGWGSAQVVLDAAVPESVRDVINRRVARLPEDTQSLLRAAAVIGRDVDAVVLEITAGIDNERVMGLLEPAVATGLLVEQPGSWDYRFEHALVRDALYAELSRLQRARIHRRVGEAMETLYVPGDPAAVGRLADHFAMAARIGAADKAVEYATRAAAAAESQFAYDEAIGFLETALAAIDPAGPDALQRRCALLIALGRAKRTRGDVVGAHGVTEEAVSLAVRLGDDRLAIDAATLFGGVTLWNWRFYGQVDERMVSTLEDLLARIDPADRRRRASLLGTLGVELFYSDRQPEGERFAREAIELARDSGDVELRARTLNNHCIAAWVPDAGERRRHVIEETLALDPLPRRAEVAARMHRMMLVVAAGDLASYDIDLARCRQLVAEMRVPDLTAQVTFAAGGRAILDGRWAEGERLVTDAFELQQRTSLWGGQWARLQLLYTSRRFQGRAGELTDEVIARADEPTLELLRSLAVLAACEAGDEPRAQALLDRWGAPIGRDWSWDIISFQWALVSAQLGTPDPGPLYDMLSPVADQFVGVGSSSASWGCNHYVLAELARRMGRPDEAATHARAALAAHRRLGVAHLEAASLSQLERFAR